MAPFSLIADKPPVRPLRQLALWGTIGPRMRGLVDVLARDDAAQPVCSTACAAGWRTRGDWDLLRIVRPQLGSPTPARLKERGRTSRLDDTPPTRTCGRRPFSSICPDSVEGWEKHLGFKVAQGHALGAAQVRRARRRRESRRPSIRPQAHEALDAVERLLHERWGDGEVYFAHDPEFRGFVHEAVPGNGRAWRRRG